MEAEYAKLEARLSRLEDSFLDGDLNKERYKPRRDEILLQLEQINETLAAQPIIPTPDLTPVFTLAESISIEDLDAESWREIVENMVDRIVIEGTGGDDRKIPATVRVQWKAEYAGLIGGANE